MHLTCWVSAAAWRTALNNGRNPRCSATAYGFSRSCIRCSDRLVITQAEAQDGRPASWIPRHVEAEDIYARQLQACMAAAQQQELDLEPEEVEQRLNQLTALLPELVPILEDIPQWDVAALLIDPPAIMEKMLQLKRLLPLCDVGLLVTEHHTVLWEDIAVVEGVLDTLCDHEGIEDLDKAFQEDPWFIWTVINYLELAERCMI